MKGDNQNSRLPVYQSRPIINAIAAKLVRPTNRATTNDLTRVGSGHNLLAQKVSAITAANITDAASLEQILPESELMQRILVSSILSPKDLMTIKLTFGLKNTNIFRSQLVSPLHAVLSKFFIDDYKIETKLPKMLRDMLFRKGSYPVLTIPESSLDVIINGKQLVSQEALTSAGLSLNNGDYVNVPALGILGNGDLKQNNTASLESFFDYKTPEAFRADLTPASVKPEHNLLISITDNPNVLKIPHITDRLARQATMARLAAAGFGRRKTGAAMEAKAVDTGKKPVTSSDTADNAFDKPMSDKQIEALYQNRRTINTPMQVIPTIDEALRPTQGHPLEMVLPPESVMPLFAPNDPTDHVGYIILLDANRNPLSSASIDDNFRQLEQHLAMNNEQVNAMLTSNFSELTGRQMNSSEIEKQHMTQLYAEMMESALLNRFKTGVLGGNIALSRSDDYYRIMLARWLTKQQTIALYVPAELMTYYAFDYNQYGVGQSLTDKNKILGSIRAMLLFANTMAGIKNAVGRSRLKIQLDEEDQHPEETVHALTDNHMRNRGNMTPFGTMHLPTIADYMNIAGVEIDVEGNSMYPTVKCEVEDFNSNKVLVDTGLEEDMRRRWIMGHGTPPELVDQSQQPEFATTFLANHQIFAQGCLEKQAILCAFVTEHMVKFSKYSQPIRDDLRAVIKENIGDYKKAIEEFTKANSNIKDYKAPDGDDIIDEIVDLYLDSFKVTLPQPDLGTLESQMQALSAKSDAYDKALEYYFSPEAFDSATFSDVATVIPMLKASYKMILMRDFMRENNILPELTKIVTMEEDDTPAMDLEDEMQKHLQGVMKSSGKWLHELVQNKAIIKKIKDDTAKLQDEDDPDGGDTGDDPMFPGGGDGSSFTDASDTDLTDASDTSLDGADDNTLDDPDAPDVKDADAEPDADADLKDDAAEKDDKK